jgi:hypothetical protein
VRNLTPSTYASDDNFDTAGLSFAAILERSARIAVVAARDVRRKDRRVCIKSLSIPSYINALYGVARTSGRWTAQHLAGASIIRPDSGVALQRNAIVFSPAQREDMIS